MSDFARLQELARDAGLQVSPPVNTAIPYVSPEMANVGDTLNCTMGEWIGEPTDYAYQWLSNGVDTTTTGASYAIPAGDAGHAVSCVVTATNNAGSTAAAPSNAVAVPAAARSGARATGATGATGPHAEHRNERTEGKRS